MKDNAFLLLGRLKRNFAAHSAKTLVLMTVSRNTDIPGKDVTENFLSKLLSFMFGYSATAGHFANIFYY
jgi:hypothetical protein